MPWLTSVRTSSASSSSPFADRAAGKKVKDRILLQVITGTTREGRFSERVTQWVIDYLRTRENIDVELVDLREYPLPFFDSSSPARSPREYPREDIARLG